MPCLHHHRCQCMHALQKASGNQPQFSSEYLETVASAKRENAAEKFGQFLTDGSDADRIDFSDTVNMFRLQRIWLIKGIRTKWIPPGHLFPKGFRPLQRGVQQTRNSLETFSEGIGIRKQICNGSSKTNMTKALPHSLTKAEGLPSYRKISVLISDTLCCGLFTFTSSIRKRRSYPKSKTDTL